MTGTLLYLFICLTISLGYVTNCKPGELSKMEKFRIMVISWFLVPYTIGMYLVDRDDEQV